jgi:two-component system, chemotaxis family, response regulator Rcp1
LTKQALSCKVRPNNIVAATMGYYEGEAVLWKGLPPTVGGLFLCLPNRKGLSTMDAQLPRPLVLVLVEDNAADERFFQEILKEVAVSTTLKVARDGEEALALLQTFGEGSDPLMPDAVFLDVRLPKKDGYEVLAELNADARLCHLPVWVFVTTENDLSKEVLARRGLAVAGYLLKPVGVKSLTQLLRHMRS